MGDETDVGVSRAGLAEVLTVGTREDSPVARAGTTVG